MPRGGAREGAGRKSQKITLDKSAISKKHKEIAKTAFDLQSQILLDDELPLTARQQAASWVWQNSQTIQSDESVVEPRDPRTEECYLALSDKQRAVVELITSTMADVELGKLVTDAETFAALREVFESKSVFEKS